MYSLNIYNEILSSRMFYGCALKLCTELFVKLMITQCDMDDFNNSAWALSVNEYCVIK